MRKRRIFLLLGGLLMAAAITWFFVWLYEARQQQDDVIRIDGETCVYDSSWVPARLVYAEAVDTMMHIRVAVFSRRYQRTDTLDLLREYPPLVSKARFLQSGIRTGDSIRCLMMERKSGDCSPEIFQFRWMPFQTQQPAANSHY